jgi:hypothetical protein
MRRAIEYTSSRLKSRCHGAICRLVDLFEGHKCGERARRAIGVEIGLDRHDLENERASTKGQGELVTAIWFLSGGGMVDHVLYVAAGKVIMLECSCIIGRRDTIGVAVHRPWQPNASAC